MTLNLAETTVVKSRPSVPYEANLFCNRIHLRSWSQFCSLNFYVHRSLVRLMLSH